MIDTNTVPNVLNRVWAEKLMADLKRDNPAADWKVFVEAKNPTMASGPLERLYALAAHLIQVSKINPLSMQLSVGQVDGTAIEYSLVEIMNQAREQLDAL